MPGKAPQKTPRGFRVDDDIDEAVRVRLAIEKRPLSKLLNVLLREWLETPAKGASAPVNVNSETSTAINGTTSYVVPEGLVRYMDYLTSMSTEVAKAVEDLAQTLKVGEPANEIALHGRVKDAASRTRELMERLGGNTIPKKGTGSSGD